MASDSPVTLDELRAHVGFNDDDDALVSGYNDAAVSWVEGYTGLLLSSQEVTEDFDRLRTPIALRYWPVTAIGAVKYLDPSGAEQTIAAPGVRLVASRRPARAAISGSLPYVPCAAGAVTVTYTAGFGDEVPGAVCQAILLLVAEFYQNREAGNISPAAERALASILRSFRRRTL